MITITIMIMATMVTVIAIRDGQNDLCFQFPNPFLEYFLLSETHRWCQQTRLILLLDTLRALVETGRDVSL
jgi:hypothetical protein